MTIKSSRLSRGDFLRLSALGAGAVIGGRLLSACSPNPAGGVSTEVITTPSITSTPVETAIPSHVLRPEIIKFYPNGLSRVIQTHHTGVWSDKSLVPVVLRQLLDASITRLTGLNDAREGWRALFRPNEKIAIKVNAFRNSALWTHAALVQEVTHCLQEAGVPAEQISVFDYQTDELKTAGYPVNVNSPGVIYSGSDSGYERRSFEVLNKKISLSRKLTQCDALINMPILKTHGMAGITFAMKNHYGSILFPDMLHSQNMYEVAALNALPEIRDRTRLIIGDALSASLWGYTSMPYWREDWIGDSIFMSFDPVAIDASGLELLAREIDRTGDNLNLTSVVIKELANPIFKYAAELGLGTNDPTNTEFIEQTISS